MNLFGYILTTAIILIGGVFLFAVLYALADIGIRLLLKKLRMENVDFKIKRLELTSWEKVKSAIAVAALLVAFLFALNGRYKVVNAMLMDTWTKQEVKYDYDNGRWD